MGTRHTYATKKCHRCNQEHARCSPKTLKLLAYCSKECHSEAARERSRASSSLKRKSKGKGAKKAQEIQAINRARGHFPPCTKCAGLPDRRDPSGKPCPGTLGPKTVSVDGCQVRSSAPVCGGVYAPEVIRRRPTGGGASPIALFDGASSFGC